MKQVSSEGNTNFPADSLPKRPDDLTAKINTMPELADSFAEIPTEQTLIEHVDIGQGLLQRRARDVATIAVANVVRLPEFYEGLRHDIEKAVDDSVLDLASKYPNEKPEVRIGLYIKEILTQQLKTPTNDLLADVNPGLISNEVIASPARIRELEADNKRLRKVREEQLSTIFELRTLRIAEGASMDELQEFDRVAKLLTAPEREAFEQGTVHNTRSLTEMFKSIVRPLISRKALEAIGLVAPRSAEMPIVSGYEERAT